MSENRAHAANLAQTVRQHEIHRLKLPTEVVGGLVESLQTEPDQLHFLELEGLGTFDAADSRIMTSGSGQLAGHRTRGTLVTADGLYPAELFTHRRHFLAAVFGAKVVSRLEVSRRPQ